MNPIQELKFKLDALDLWQGNIILRRNEFLNVKGSTDTKLYFVQSGSLRIFIQDEQEEHTIRFGYKDSFIAALDSFITEKPSGFYMQVLKKAELKVIDKAAYMHFIQADPENLRLWHQILEHLIFQQIERETDLLTTSPQERYKRVLKRSPQLFQEIPHKYIASYLRMTPETLSRLKKSLDLNQRFPSV